MHNVIFISRSQLVYPLISVLHGFTLTHQTERLTIS